MKEGEGRSGGEDSGGRNGRKEGEEGKGGFELHSGKYPPQALANHHVDSPSLSGPRQGLLTSCGGSPPIVLRLHVAAGVSSPFSSL